MSGEAYRVFVSSPSDVMPEREQVSRVLDKLNAELAGHARFETVRWEESYYTATQTFQRQIPKPSETALVVCILWKRLGSELPPELYRRTDGTPYASGTEYEFEEARDAALRGGVPDILVYRKTARVLFDAEQVSLQQAQYQMLEAFWQRWFRSEAGHFVAGFQSFVETDEFAVLFERHLRSWLDRRQQARWGEHRGSPFRGLQPFEEEHTDVFFGRRWALEHLRARTVSAHLGGCGFVLVLGASGTGKSSLVRAGLVPRLRRPGSVPGIDFWRRMVVRPGELGSEPILGLCRALFQAEVLPELAAGDYARPEDLAALAARSPELLVQPLKAALRRAAQASLGHGSAPQSGLILVLDQLEELFSRGDGERDAVVGLLEALARSGSVLVIATMRSDFYAVLAENAGLRRLKEDGASFDLMPPGPADIREIIQGPAALAGLSFENDPRSGQPIDSLLEQAAQAPGALPLLQFTLDELYHRRFEGRLAVAAYSALGGLEGAIHSVAQTVFEGLAADARAALGGVLMHLVSDAREDVAPTLRSASRAEVATSPEAAALVEAFMAARLLVAGGTAGTPMLRLAHEALIGGWSVARALIDADREVYRTRARVEAQAEIWEQKARHADYLLAPGRPLAEAAELLRGRPEALGPEVRAFVAQSIGAEEARQARQRQEAEARARAEEAAQRQIAEREAAAARRVAQRTRIAAGLLAALLVVAVGVGLYAEQQRHDAESQRERAQRNEATAVDAMLRFARVLPEVAVPPGSIDAPWSEASKQVWGAPSSEPLDPPILAAQAGLLLALAKVDHLLGAPGELLHHGRQALDILDRIPSTPDVAHDRARAHHFVGMGLAATGDAAAAAAHYDTAIKELESLLGGSATGPATATWRRSLADSYQEQGDLLLAAPDSAAGGRARSAYEKALALRQELVRGAAGDAQLRNEIAWTYNKLGDVSRCEKDDRRSAEQYRKARDGLLDLIRDHGAHPQWLQRRGLIENNLALRLVGLGDYANATARLRDAVDLFEQLAASQRANLDIRSDLGWTLDNLGEALLLWQWFDRDPKRLTEARQRLQRAAEIRRTIAEAVGDTKPQWQNDLRYTQANLEIAGAMAKEVAQDFAGAAQAFQAAADLNRSVVGMDCRGGPLLRLRTALVLEAAAASYRRAGAESEVRPLLVEAEAALQGAAGAAAGPPFDGLGQRISAELTERR